MGFAANVGAFSFISVGTSTLGIADALSTNVGGDTETGDADGEKPGKVPSIAVGAAVCGSGE